MKIEKRGRIKKRLIVGIVLILLFLIIYFQRYSTILSIIKAIPESFKFVNLFAVMGLVVAFIGFYQFDKLFKINFKRKHYWFIIIMSVMAFVLSFLYFRFPYIDKFQHFFFPIMACSIIYHMVSKLNLEKRYKLLFTFFIVIGVITIFELIEYLLDLLFNLYLQGVFLGNPNVSENYRVLFSPIDDTMIDLFMGLLGSLFYVSIVCLRNKIQ
jgi:hypothetical protein